MEVKINKEILNYTESMCFGLSLRQFDFSLLACGVVVGPYFLLRPHFGTETLSWMCILGAAPFAAMLTLTEQAEYEIVAVFKTVAYCSDGYRYDDFDNSQSEEELSSRIQGASLQKNNLSGKI